MKIKIYDGTRKSGTNLCESCTNYSRRITDREDRRVCSAHWEHPELLRDPVQKCTDHERRYTTPVEELVKIAWVLRTGKGGKKIGFARFDDLAQEEKTEIEQSTRS